MIIVCLFVCLFVFCRCAGTSLVSEHALLDVPSALATFYTDLNKPQTPSVAVAAGPYIFIYRNLRPYYKFTVPYAIPSPPQCCTLLHSPLSARRRAHMLAYRTAPIDW